MEEQPQPPGQEGRVGEQSHQRDPGVTEPPERGWRCQGEPKGRWQSHQRGAGGAGECEEGYESIRSDHGVTETVRSDQMQGQTQIPPVPEGEEQFREIRTHPYFKDLEPNPGTPEKWLQ